MSEPKVEFATIRDAIDDNGWQELHIECRFSDGQKSAAVVVDADFPDLAKSICDFLNSPSKEQQCR